MLSTSTSQYLQPEYIQPLPSSLDVNNSPLALLAQTCSSIGKETGSKGTSLGGASVDADRKSSSHTTGGGSGKESGGTRAKSESPPTAGRHGAGGGAEERSRSRTSFNDKKESGGQGQRSSAGVKGTTPKPGFRVPPAPSKDCSTAGERSNGDSAGDTSGGRGCSSKDGLHSSHLSSSSVVGRTSGHGSSSSSLGGSASGSGKSGGSGSSSCSSMLLELNQEALNKSALHAAASLHPMYGGSLKDGLQALHGSLGPSPLGALPFLGYPLSLDPLAAAYSASLAAHCSGLAGGCLGGLSSSSQKSPASGIASTSCSAAVALSPFVSYARVKTASGGTTLVPVCKDPYCTHCQVAVHGAQLACTGPGCGQCAAPQAPDKGSPTGLASPAAGLPFFHGGGGGGGVGASGVVVSGLSSALCSHAAFSTPPSLQGSTSHNSGGGGGGGGPLVTPYVCNWVQGSDYCGKRFSGSDELLQHLRSHTSTADPLVSPFNAAAAAGLPLSAIGFPLGGFLGCPTLSPGLLSLPSYPRSLSPNSLLSAVRYHPYKPPSLSVLQPGSAAPGLPPAGAFPSLAAFYSPYAFYGQRIGAAAGP